MEKKVAQLKAKFEADSSFAEKIFALENANEVQDFLKAQGIDFSLEEIEEIKDGFVKIAEKADGELSDEALEEVAGGSITAAGVMAAAALITALGGPSGIANMATGLFGSIRRRRW